MLLSFCGFALAEDAEGRDLPDSVLNVDHIYKYLFTDKEKSEQIMAEMRRRKACPAWELDYIEGDLYYNTGRNREALRFYDASLGSSHVKGNDTLTMELLHRKISCYDALHDEVNKMVSINSLLDLAKKLGDKPMESIALFNMGKSLRYQGDSEQGYEYMERGVQMMEDTDYRLKYDNLRYEYKTLILFYERDKRYTDLLRALDKWEEVVTASNGDEYGIDGLAASERKDLYAMRAIALSRSGRDEEAAECYKMFKSIDEDLGRNSYLIMPYLFDTRQYDEIFRISLPHERFLIEQKDTVNYHMTSALKFLGNAYSETGDYEKASSYYRRLAVLRDSLKAREQKSAALELAEIYKTNEQAAQLRDRELELHVRAIVILCITVLLVAAIVFIFRIQRDKHLILRKNEAMKGIIDELLTYKNEFFLRQSENTKLRSELQQFKGLPSGGSSDSAAGEGVVSQLAEADSEEQEDMTDAAGQSAVTSGEATTHIELTENDRAVYDRISHEVISRKLYLRPDFSKTELMKEIHVPSYKFATMFRQFAGCSFSQYIQDRRMDYAISLMREHPQWSMEAVAKEAQMSKTSFYRQFQKKYGMSPTNYMEMELSSLSSSQTAGNQKA